MASILKEADVTVAANVSFILKQNRSLFGNFNLFDFSIVI